MEKTNFIQETKQIKIWKPIQKDYRKPIICLIAAEVVVFAGIFLLWGYQIALAAGVIMVVLTGIIHYCLQKKIKLENSFFYLDQNELYLISPDKKDKELYAYLQNPSEERGEEHSLNALMKNVSKRSMVCKISEVSTLSAKGNGKYKAYISYKMVPYAYNGIMTLPLKNCYEDFEGLIQIFKDRALQIV